MGSGDKGERQTGGGGLGECLESAPAKSYTVALTSAILSCIVSYLHR